MEQIDQKLITLRGPRPADKNFFLASWLRGLYYGDFFWREVPKDIFMKTYHPVIEQLLARRQVTVACLTEDPDVILGYSVSAPGGVLDWVFVKAAFRGRGVAKSLVPNNTTVVTHLTKVGLSIMRKHPPMIFNPFAIN